MEIIDCIMKIGIVLCNLGGPRDLKDVQPFLYRLFMDEEIIPIRLKGIFRKAFAYAISHIRAKKTRKKYACIGGKSPINENTEKQRIALQEYFTQHIPEHTFKVVTAMRFGFPNAHQAFETLQSFEPEQIIILPLYPQYSYNTTQAAIDIFQRICTEKEYKNPVYTIQTYHTHPLYVQAVNARINEQIQKLQNTENTVLLFSAHGIPIREIAKGDPYQRHIEESVQAIMQARNYDFSHVLSYQSRVGPMEWLKPYTHEVLQELSQKKVHNVIVIPISFVSDHLETLYEIGVEYAQLAQQLGIPHFSFIDGLNDHPIFIHALANLVQEILQK